MMMFYQSLYDDFYWVRPFEQFIGNVKHEGEYKKRFTLIE